MDAIIEIYKKYFDKYMPNTYNGRGVVALWYDDATWETGKGFDFNHSNPGIVSKDCKNDPLWQEFADILPYMGKSATITKITPGSVMMPHVDRKWRPEAIYFPISGCSEECYSEYYDIPKNDTMNSQSVGYFPQPIARYAVNEYAYLTNVHEWHGVKNLSNLDRTAFGWNFKNIRMTYKQCREILGDLGYI